MSIPYYAFKGDEIIAGPFSSRDKARAYKKVGHKCDFCDGYSGGNTVCFSCLAICFTPPSKREKKMPRQLSLF